MDCNPTPEPEHKWLMQLVGEWDFQSKCVMPDGQPATSSGREVVRSVGDIWVIGELVGTMPGGGGGEGEMTGIMTVGFDTRTRRFVGSWVGSPMTGMFVYDGTRDASGKVLTLNCTGPAFTDPTATANYRDIVTIDSPNERRLTSQFQDDDGNWHTMMEATFRRLK